MNSIPVTIDVSWPSSIPLPFVDYDGAVRTSTIVSPIEQAALYRRARFLNSIVPIGVQWVLTPTQYDAFVDFFTNTIYNGSALFKIELRYPRNSDLDEWVVRFDGSFLSSFQDGTWLVSSGLDLLHKVGDADEGVPEGWTEYQVDDESSSGAGHQSYFTADTGDVYYAVRTS